MKIASKQALWIYIFILFFCLLVFAIYSSTSLVNHCLLFRTYALDLAMYSHAIRNTASCEIPMFTLSPGGEEMPFLATHFCHEAVKMEQAYRTN